ncbi:LysM peptidoglycan-binding domain-containing protein [Candidatus Poribacteria bacterium]|nr:LysM peptidoglycan-binding domain-containing protein [Candidatus Poribacteria bacterium]
MKIMKSILRFSLVLSICLFLTGAAYILTASAKITPNPDMEGTTLITIVKGDTLWDLAIKHLEDPMKWPEFRQYNTFTNPDQIYPDEMMRIPAKMVEEIIEEAVEEDMVTMSELEMIKEELAAMAARAMAAEEAVGVTAADVTAIKKMVEDLIAQQKMVEGGLQGVKDEVAGMPAVVDKINASLMEHAEASKKKISKVHEEVEAARGDVAELRKTVKEKHKAGMEAHKASEEMLAAGIKANADSLDKLHTMHRGATEEPNNTKRTLAFLTTLAGTAAWFALSSLDMD